MSIFKSLFVRLVAALVVLFGGSIVLAVEEYAFGNKFFFVSPEVMTWKEAATYCVLPEFNDRFRLARVDSETENNDAAIALTLVGKNAPVSEQGAWLAGYNPTGNKWIWGDLSSFTYVNWGLRQPDTTPGNKCLWLKLRSDNLAVWATAPCEEKKRVVCQGRAFTKVYDWVNPTERLNFFQVREQCKGTVANPLSPAENIYIRHRTNGPTPSPMPVAPTRKPTPKPSKKPKPPHASTPCCTGGNIGECCPTSTTQGACDFCRCCDCCKVNRPNYDQCCRRTFGRKCGCGPWVRHKTKRPTKKPNTPARTKRPTKKPGSLGSKVAEEEEYDEDEDTTPGNDEAEDDGEIHQIDGLWANGFTDSPPPKFVFLAAVNNKVGIVKEENASYIWNNGISMKPIGYLDRTLTEQYTNWATFPAEDPKLQCAVLRTNDGKWESFNCTGLAFGALCEIRTVKKKFQVYTTERVDQDTAGSICAISGAQLGSIKTRGELDAATSLYRQLNEACNGCLQGGLWTSGRHYGRSFQWADGQIFNYDNVPVGLINFFNEQSTSGECVSVGLGGSFIRTPCENKLFVLCEKPQPSNKPQPIPQFPPANACYPGCLDSYLGDGVW